MADKNYQLQIEVLAKDMASKALGGIGKAIAGVAVAAGGIAAIVGAGKMLKDFGEMAAEEAVGIQKLQKSVENTGANWGEAAEGIETYLAAQTKRIALDDGEGRAVLQSLTEITGDYKKSMDLLPLAADLAAAKGMDLATASQLVGRVAAGNTGILARYGIVLKKGASATEALGAMTEKFGGQAEVFAKSYQGQLKIFDIQFNNLKETIGGAILPIMTKVATALADLATKAIPVVERAIAKLMPVLNAVGVAGQAVIDVLRGTGGDIPWEDMLPAWAVGAAYAISEAFAGLKAGIDSFKLTIQMGGGVWDALNNGISTFLENIGASEGVLTFVRDAFYEVGEIVRNLASGFSEAVGSLAGMIRNLFEGDTETAVEYLTEVIGYLLSAFGVADDAIMPTIEAIYDFGESIMDMGGAALDALGPLMATFQSLGATIMDAFSKVAPVVQDLFGRVFTGQVKTVGAIFNTVFPQIIKIVQTVMTAMQAAIKQAVPVVIALFEMLAPKITAVFEIIRRIVADVVPFVSKLIQEMVAFALKTFGTLISWVTANMPLISQTITTVLNAIQTVWNAVWPVLQVVVITVWEVIKTAISTALNVILGIIKTVMQIINGDWAGAWESFKGVVTTVLSGVFTIIQTVLGSIATLIGGKVGEFIQMGADLIGGLVQGIEDNASAVMDALLKIISDGVSAVKKFFGIKSPSTVMITIGQDLMGGLVIGIESGGKDVVETMRAVINDLTEIIKDLTGAMRAMSKTEIPGNINAFKQPFIDVIQVIVDAINEAEAKIGEEALAAAVSLVDSIDKVIGLIEPALSALASFVEFPAVGNLREKAAFLEEAINLFVYYVWRTANFWKDVALDKAMEFSEAAQKVIGLISPAVEALAGFIDFPAVGNLHEKSAFLEEAINLFVYYVWRTAVFWRDVGLDAAALFAETATRVITIITPAVEALASIGTLGDIDEMTMRHRMAAWETGVNVVVYHIKRVADFWEGVALDSAATFAEVVAKVIGVIKPTVDSLAALAEYKPVANIAGMLDRDNPDNIFSQLDQLLTALRGYALNWGATAEDITAKFAELQAFVGPVVEGLGLIKPVVDAIAAIAVYAPAENLANMLDRDNPNNIFSQLDQILTQLRIYAGNWGVDAEAVAANFAALKAFVGPVVEGLGLIKPVIDAIAAIASYEAVKGLATKIINFANDLDMVLRGLKAISELWVKVKEDGTLDDAVLAAISLFSTNVQSAVSFIKPAIEAVETLAKYKAAEKLAEKMTKFTNDVIIAVGKIREMALNPALGADTLALATTFATDLGKLTSTMSSAITGLGQVLSYKGYSASKAMGALQQDIDKMLVALGQIVANLDGVLGVEKAEAFEAAMRAIYESITAGLGYIVSLSGTDATTGASGALEAFSKAAVQSMKDALKAVNDGLALIVATFNANGPLFYSAGYRAGLALGNGIKAGLAAAMSLLGPPNSGSQPTQPRAGDTYNINVQGTGSAPRDLRTTVTALQMAGTA